MGNTLNQLGELLLTALPTFFLIFFLTYYLKVVFFKPFEKTLRERFEATEGARQGAAESLKTAAAKTAEYEGALRTARGETYLAQEKILKDLQNRAAAEIAEARKHADDAIRQAKLELAAEVEAAKAGLAGETEKLARQIAESILRRQAA